MFPAGAVRVKVTLAPEAGLPPFNTLAVIGTVLRRAKLDAGTEVLTVSDGAAINVTLAEPDPTRELLDALAFTA